jgi:hypothetical protein
VFGRRRKQEEAAAEAVREADRRALFAQLASRPENVCPFLGLADDRVGYHDTPGDAHRCYAFGDPAPLSTEQQSKVCLDRGYGNCPRYLRGVLVIPTDELEALRRPVPRIEPVVAAARPVGRRRRSPAWLIFGILVLLVGAGGALAWATGRLPIAFVTPSGSATPSATATSTSVVTPIPTGPTPTPELTPAPEDVFLRYEVSVSPGSYTLFRVDDSGMVTGALEGEFTQQSFAVVDRIDTGGQLSWRTASGGYAGLSYIRGRSGPFIIRGVYRGVDGSLRYKRLTPAET